MKEIFRSYGKMILAVCAVMILILLTFGMMELQAQRNEIPDTGNFNQYQDGLFTRQLYTRKDPTITWVAGSLCSAGTLEELASCFTAEDEDGEQLPVTILSVCLRGGGSCQKMPDASGIYEVTVTATDKLGKTATVLVEVPITK